MPTITSSGPRVGSENCRSSISRSPKKTKPRICPSPIPRALPPAHHAVHPIRPIIPDPQGVCVLGDGWGTSPLPPLTCPEDAREVDPGNAYALIRPVHAPDGILHPVV